LLGLAVHGRYLRASLDKHPRIGVPAADAAQLGKLSIQILIHMMRSAGRRSRGDDSGPANCLRGRNDIVNLKGSRMLALRIARPDEQNG
jgi:hypothetical protein